MKKILLTSFVTVLLLQSRAFSQGETALPFLLTHPAPYLNGMAGAYTALPTNDAFGFYFNPAQLGNFGRDKNFSLQSYSEKTNWLPSFNISDLTFRSTAINAGYNFKNANPNLPISLGFGYIQTELDYGENAWSDENGNITGIYHSIEKYSAFAAGVGLDYYVLFNMGYTYKKIESNLGPPDLSVKTETADFGLQITVPFISLYQDIFSKEITIAGTSIPFFNFSMGYTLSNFWEKFLSYWSSPLSDPLPKQARIGYAVSLGFDTESGPYNLRMFRFDWASEARDLLVDRNEVGADPYYVDSPGAIKIWDNVFLGKSSLEVSIYQGWQIALAETFSYSNGRFWGPRYSSRQKTAGFKLESTGLFKWLSAHNRNDRILEFLASHINFSYMQTRYTTTGYLNNTEFKGFSLSMFGF